MIYLKCAISILITCSFFLGSCGPNAGQLAATYVAGTIAAASPTPQPTYTPLPTTTFTATPAPSNTPIATDTPVPKPPKTSYTCSDPIGCIEIGPTDPIHLAYLLVVSGPNSNLGIDSRNGVEIAIDDAGGKILGHEIRFDGEDGGCSATGGLSAATKLVSDPTIVAVIGPSCSAETRAAEPLLSEAGFVTISPSNTAPDLTDESSPNHYAGYFRTSQNDVVQSIAAADFAYSFLGIRTAATIQDGTLFADRLQQTFADEFTRLGGTVTLQTSIKSGQSDMSSVLDSIASGNPELIYFPVFLPQGEYIVEQARTTPGLENAKLISADSLYSPELTQSAGAAVDGFMVTSPIFGGGDAYDSFVRTYYIKYGQSPLSIFHAHAYDAFNILKAAIEKVAIQESDGTIYIPRQALRDAVAATTNFQGLSGVLTCSPTGECANPIIGVYEYSAGQYPPEFIWSTKDFPNPTPTP